MVLAHGELLGAAHVKARRSQETLTLPAGLHIWNSAPNVQVGENGGPEGNDENEQENENENRMGRRCHVPNRERTSVAHCELQSANEGEEVKWGLNRRHTCLAAANEARTITEKMNFMLSRRAGEDKIAEVSCGALERLHIGSKHAPQARRTSSLGSSMTITQPSSFSGMHYAKRVEPIYWLRAPERGQQAEIPHAFSGETKPNLHLSHLGPYSWLYATYK